MSEITLTTAVSGGKVTSDGGARVTSRGVCWNTSEDPATSDNKTENGSDTGSFKSTLTGLNPNWKYFLRAYATNSEGTVYGDQADFTTESGINFNPNLTYGTMTDVEGNTYKTIQIGTQTWMAENLRTTKYNDNAPIPLVTDNTAWSNLTTPAYCWYNNDSATHKGVYGCLYNWHTVRTDILCPTGWHVPSLDEWIVLTLNQGGIDVSGSKLMEADTTHWIVRNTWVTNESGFTALPGGYRRYDGSFNFIGGYGNWWFSTESSATLAWRWYMDYTSTVYKTIHDKRYGFSIRCLKN